VLKRESVLKYRQEIDGLRAIAIIPVLLFHVGVPYLSGGYLGVDVFFVISGFLITRILVEETSNNTFSVINFYERRARRILPALVVVMLITALVIPFIDTSPKILMDFGKSAMSVILFLSNVYFFLTSGYFGVTSELSPLLHTWSLAVEEQFYLFFPLLAMFLLPIRRKFFIYTLCFIILISLGLAEWGWRNSPTGNFYLAPTRAWELLIGSLGAIFIVSEKIKLFNPITQSLLSGLGLLMILASYFLFLPETPHPSVFTLIPVVGSLFVILFSNSNNLCGRVLKFTPFVYIGLISYSLYLWHQPVLALAKLKLSTDLNMAIQVGLLLSIFLISTLTYKYIETPFRNKKIFSKAKVFRYSAISMAGMICISIIFMSNTEIQRVFIPKKIKQYDMLLTAQNSHEHQIMYEEECKFWSPILNTAFKVKFNDCSQKYGKAVVVLGGSHGMDLYNAIAINSRSKFVVSLSRGYCRAHEFIGSRDNVPRCQYEDFKKFAANNSNHILSVIYTQTPDQLFTENMNTAKRDNLSIEHIEQVVSYLSGLRNELNIDVLMVGMLPPMKKAPIELDYTKGILEELKNNISVNAVTLTKYVDKVFREKVTKHNIRYISKFEGFQLNLPEDLISNGNITYSDSRHLSAEGEKIFGSRLVRYLGL